GRGVGRRKRECLGEESGEFGARQRLVGPEIAAARPGGNAFGREHVNVAGVRIAGRDVLERRGLYLYRGGERGSQQENGTSPQAASHPCSVRLFVHCSVSFPSKQISMSIESFHCPIHLRRRIR